MFWYEVKIKFFFGNLKQIEQIGKRFVAQIRYSLVLCVKFLIVKTNLLLQNWSTVQISRCILT